MNKDTLPSNACHEGAEYYNRFPTGQAFWEACERPDWMLWAHARSLCPAPWAYAVLAYVWAGDADAAADAARYADAARKQQCDDIRAALPVFPGFVEREYV